MPHHTGDRFATKRAKIAHPPLVNNLYEDIICPNKISPYFWDNKNLLEVLNNNKINKPFFLSGGIGLEDIDAIRSFTHPFLYAVDINSKVEIEPGVKNLETLKQFIDQIKK